MSMIWTPSRRIWTPPSRQRGFVCLPGGGMGLVPPSGGGGGGGESDPYYANTSLILNMLGSNGSTTFTDQSPSPKTVTTYGNTQITTAQSPFAGGTSAVFDGDGDYLQIPDSDGWNFGEGEFTVEAWIRLSDTSSPMSIVGQGFPPGGTGFDRGWHFMHESGQLKFGIAIGGGSPYFTARTSGISANTWYLASARRVGNSMQLFIGDAQIGSNDNYSGVTIFNSSQFLRVGGSSGATSGWFMNGHIGPLRITKGVARTIAVPTGVFPTA